MKQKEQHQPFTHQSITKNQSNSIYKNNLEETIFSMDARIKLKFYKIDMEAVLIKKKEGKKESR